MIAYCAPRKARQPPQANKLQKAQICIHTIDAACALCNLSAMKLSDYIKLEGNSATALADKAGVAVSSITRAAKGDIYPSADLMRLIIEHTDGQVRPDDFFDLPERSAA